MIKILKQPLLKERTTLQLFRPIRLGDPTHSFAAAHRRPPTVYFQYINRRSSAFASRPSWSRRCYSTVPNPPTVKENSAAEPPPSNSPHKRPKVDLRPAPIKHSKEQGKSQQRLPPPSSPQSKTTRSTTTTAAADPTVSEGSATSSRGMKHDIAEATRRGVLSPPPEGATRFQRIWHQIVQLFKFYSRGLKLIMVTHRRQAAQIRRRAAEAKANGEPGALTRWEARFLRKYDRDLLKLVPFVLTLIILEEALPLVVLFAPGLLPSTCILPSQRERIETKRRAKQMVFLETIRAEVSRLGPSAISSLEKHGVRSLDPVLTRSILGAFSRPTWGPLFLLRRRIDSYLAYLASDDALLIREESALRLHEDELVEALEERGLTPDFRSVQHQRNQLEWWLRGARDGTARLELVLRAATKKHTHEH